MASSQEFNETLREINNLVDAIGDEVVDTVSGTANQGVQLDGYECRHGNHTYQIFGAQVWDYFTVRYSYNIAHQLAALQAQAGTSAQSGAQNQQVDITQQKVDDATEDIRERLDADEIPETRLQLMNRIGEPEFGVELMTEGDLVVGFRVNRKIYPYVESFTPREFDRAVQGVVTLGHKGQDYLVHQYGLKEFIEDLGLNDETEVSQSGRGEDSSSRGFE